MDVKTSKTDPSPEPEPHHIYLRGGQVVSVMACSFRVHLNKKTVSFYGSNARSKKIFWLLEEVNGIVASSALAELPPLVRLQSQVEGLMARMDSLENNLGDIVTRAVNAAFAARGF